MAGRIRRDFTAGSIPKMLLQFMLPFMASNAMQVLYSTIDMAVVGKFVGTAGLSGVSQASQIVNFMAMVCFGFANAGQVLVAQALGAGKKKEMNGIIGTLFSFVALMALGLTAVLIFGKDLILQLMNIEKGTDFHAYATEYMYICGGGLVLTAGYNMVSAVLRGMGDSKRPFLFIAIASAVNLILDLLFTGLLGWGVAGAAWATIIGQAVAVIYAVCYLFKRKEEFGFDFRKESFRLDGHYLRMLATLGAPMAVQSAFIHISMLYVNSLVNDIGEVASATFGVGIRIDEIITKLSIGIQYAALPMVSQNVAAGKQERSVKVVWWTWLYSTVFTGVCMGLYWLFGKELFMLFSDDTAVHQLSGEFIRGILWMFPALAIMRGTSAFIQGIGNAKLSMALAILDGVALRIGLSWLFGIALGWGFYGLVLGYGLAAYGCAIPGFIYFVSGIWKKRKVLAEEI